MSLHDIHHHGRVFHGEAARNIMALRKRDSHGDQIKMNVPAGFPVFAGDVASTDGLEVAQKDVSVVFVTMPQTFAGPASFVTLTGPLSFPSLSLSNPFAPATTTSAPAQSAAQTSATPASIVEPASSQPTEPSTSELVASQVPTSDIPTSLLTATAPTSVMVGVPIATTRASTSSSVQLSSSIVSSSSSSASATNGLSGASSQQGISQSGGGLSGGASAGLAIGIILAIGAVAGLLFFCWRRRKNPQAEEDLNEKHRSFADASARSIEAAGKRGSNAMGGNVTTTAPRLSLRPVTAQFLPAFGGEQNTRIPNGLGIGVAAVPSEKSKSAWERVPSNNSSTTRGSNPFDDATPLSEKSARPASPPSDNNPFDETSSIKSNSPQKLALNTTGSAFDITAAVAAAGVTSAAAKGSANSSAPAPIVATGPGPQGSNNVHRVQLDFKPSMDDELELKSGQLVRMLHEYDDGWSLCIRMDRSQQGVAPRTCLSKLPVKPRQGPPPQNQGPRPSPQNAPRAGPSAASRDASGPVYNPQTPASVPNATRPVNGPMYPRPLANSPRDRAQSVTQSSTPPAGAHIPVSKPATLEMPESAPAPTLAAVSEPHNATNEFEVTPASLPAPARSPVERSGTTSPTAGAVPSRKPVPGQAM